MKKIVTFIILAAHLFGVSPAFAWDDNMIAKERETLKDWSNVLELQCFLALDDAPIVLKAGADGKISFSGQCEDFAFQLRDRAMLWGRYLDVEIITRQEYYAHYKKWLPLNTVHAINKAVIGNELWFVDAQTKEIWHQYDLD